MGFAVEMYFDLPAEQRILRLWDRLARQGITSVLPEIGARPHISLAVFDELEPEVVRPQLKDFARKVGPVQLGLAAVGTFPTLEGVVFLVPTVSSQLLQTHAQLCQLMERIGLKTNEFYRPGRWVPHCTVATDLAPDCVAEAVEVCRKSEAFGQCELTSVGMVSFRPIREICEFQLGETSE